jgi:hypothetical protein
MMMLAYNMPILLKFDSLHNSEYRQQTNKDLPVNVCFSSCEDHQNSSVCSDEAFGKVSLSRDI